jgi:hypothetical protein
LCLHSYNRCNFRLHLEGVAEPEAKLLAKPPQALVITPLTQVRGIESLTPQRGLFLGFVLF